MVTNPASTVTSYTLAVTMTTLTARRIDSEKPDPDKDRRIADSLGLYLKVARNGTKTFTFRFTYGIKRHELTLGTYPATTLAEARRKHTEARRTLESGKNPLQAEHAQQQALKTALSVSDLITEWNTRILTKTYKRPEAALSTLKRDVESQIGKFLIKDVTARDVALLVNKVVDRGSPVAANRTLLLTKKLFGYAVEQHHISATPVTMTRKGAGGKETSRDRALSFEELRIVCKTLDTHPGRTSWQARMALKLIILTGQRPGEVSAMEWAHIDLENAVWRIPAVLTKSARTHTVHLSPQVISILTTIHSLTGSAAHVLQSTSNAAKPFDRHSVSHAVRDLFTEDGFASVEPFTPHDLRRSFATRLSDLGTAPHVIEKILNHQMGGVMAVYNRAEYQNERCAALDLWGRKIEELSTTDKTNVVHLQRSAA